MSLSESIKIGLKEVPQSEPLGGDPGWIEDWIVETLNARSPLATSSAAFDHPEVSPTLREARRILTRTANPTAGPRPRLRIVGRRGITVACLLDQVIVHSEDVESVGRELRKLAADRHACIVLDFSHVQRFSSQLLAAVARLHRHCETVRGRLKLCGLRPDLRAVFAVSGLDRTIPIAPDLHDALHGDWPEQPALRPLPIETLHTLANQTFPDVVPSDTTPQTYPFTRSSTGSGSIDSALVLDVLVLTPLSARLETESSLLPLRASFEALFEPSAPRRVVLDLQHLTVLSSRALGLLATTALRLRRADGALRFCHVPPTVRPVLEHVRLNELVAIYPTVDEAVLAAWEPCPEAE